MSGQSAALSVSEVKAMIKRTEASSVGAHQGKKTSSTEVELLKKQSHQGK